jgi:hypothetical protein
MAGGRYQSVVQIVPAGDNAVLIELGDVTAAELHARAREARAQPGVVAVIPGHSSLYVIRSHVVASRVEGPGWAGGAPTADPGPSTAPGVTHHIRVNFDGPDLPPNFVPRAFELTVRYLGFRGGFGYLDGWPEHLAMPRRPTSRPVSRGSFAVAGNVAGFYPIDTPGGWNILGHTDYDLAFALAPGDRIVIEPTDEPLPLPPLRETAKPSLAMPVSAPDWSRVERGMPPGGPFDDVAASLLEGDLVECAMVWPRVEGRVAWVGPDLTTGEGVPGGRIVGGLRGYLGGRVVGSATRGERNVIRAMRGPHDIGLSSIECEVTPKLDRVGIRLRPLTPVDYKAPADLESIGMQCGTIQLHPDGSLVAMGPDHPVTGGYLQPLTVITSERWKLAQLSPGERVTFAAGQLPNW